MVSSVASTASMACFLVSPFCATREAISAFVTPVPPYARSNGLKSGGPSPEDHGRTLGPLVLHHDGAEPLLPQGLHLGVSLRPTGVGPDPHQVEACCRGTRIDAGGSFWPPELPGQATRRDNRHHG